MAFYILTSGEYSGYGIGDLIESNLPHDEILSLLHEHHKRHMEEFQEWEVQLKCWLASNPVLKDGTLAFLEPMITGPTYEHNWASWPEEERHAYLYQQTLLGRSWKEFKERFPMLHPSDDWMASQGVRIIPYTEIHDDKFEEQND